MPASTKTVFEKLTTSDIEENSIENHLMSGESVSKYQIT